MRRAVLVPLALTFLDLVAAPAGAPRAEAACVSYRDYLHMLGSCEPGGYARGMEYRAPYLYLADYTGAVRVVDASDPARMAVIGSLALTAIPMDLDVAGAVGCVPLNSRTLQLIDFSDPTAPVPLGSVPIPSDPQSVAMAGRYAFVTATQYPGEEGLYVFDLQDPAAPTLVTRVDVGHYPRNAEVDGGYAYVLTVDALSILDISDPTVPVVLGSVSIPGQPRYLTLRGSYVYVVCLTSDEARSGAGAEAVEAAGTRSWGDGLYVIDRSDPAHPALVGTYAPEEQPPFLGIDLWKNYAIVSRDQTLMVMDVAVPTAPRVALEIGVQRFAMEFAVAGDVLFAWGDRLMSYDLREPFSPKPVAVIDGTEGCGMLAVRGDYAFTAQTWGREFHSIDLSVPEQPVVTTIQLPFEDVLALAATEAEGGTPCVYAGGNGHPDSTAIIDVSDPRDPRVVNFLILAHHPADLETEGTRLYAIEGAAGVRIYDIADPIHPALMNTIDFTYTPQMLAADGDRLYVGRRIESMDHLFIYDVADAAHPVLLGTSTLPLFPCALEIDGDLAYVADGTHGVLVLDVSDPASVTLVSAVEAIGDASDLCRDGSLLYVADFRTCAGVHVIDVSDPHHPEIVGRFHCDAPYTVQLISGNMLLGSFRSSAMLAPLDCSSSGIEPPAGRPLATRLSLSSNPTSGRVEITVDLPASGPTLLSLYDPAGRLVRVLRQGTLESGGYVLGWDGLDDHGRPVPAGVYFLRLEAGPTVQARSLVRIR